MFIQPASKRTSLTLRPFYELLVPDNPRGLQTFKLLSNVLYPIMHDTEGPGIDHGLSEVKELMPTIVPERLLSGEASSVARTSRSMT